MPMRRTAFNTLLVLALLGLATLTFFLTPDTGAAQASRLNIDASAYTVTILRDTWGVPHIYGQTDPDVAFGLAYAHAEDDFLTIQQSLIAARGQLASIYGIDTAANDYLVQLLRIKELLDREYPNLSPDVRALCEAYAEGLNYYAQLHPTDTLYGLFPVTGRDIVATSVHKSPLFFGLERTITRLFDENHTYELSERLDLASPYPVDDPIAALYTNLASNSNTAAIGPARTPDGSTYFLVNSHQPWTGPVTWYEVNLHSEDGWHFSGALFPGMPVGVVGHTDRLSWAYTVSSPDLVDVYVLEINPDNPNQYRVDGQWRDLEVRQAPITVLLAGRIRVTVNREVLWSVYGPTLRQPHGVYSLRYAAMDSAGIYEQLYRMNRATNFEEWYAAQRDIPGIPTFNIGYADADGNIFYAWNARMPRRSEHYDWDKYLPGNTSETLWTEYVPYEALPQVLNPPTGFIQNANSTPYQTTVGPGNPNPADYSPTFRVETHMTNRALRMNELFSADDSITFDEFTAYKFDDSYSTRSIIPRFVRTIVNADFSSDPAAQQAQALLAEWDLSTNPGSRGAAIMTTTLSYLYQRDDIQLSFSRLTEGVVSRTALLDSFTRAVRHLETHFGTVEITLGDIQRLRRGAVDLPVGGGPDVVRALYASLQPDGRLAGNNGDGYVMLVHWRPDGTPVSYSIHQFGAATLDATSLHYADQAPLFANLELKPVWFTEAEVRTHLEREYTPGQ